ncbi:T9SS type A sorting domain-containing protein [Mariniflexile jejuense]|uniref:T9SS type A sorting domain-containing protein n=1 Tax=Mariniflexile jejuense TaxID=1173582 RepID=A0ABW3JIP1_9FLAO
MKKLYFLLFTILISVASFGQVINEIDPDQTGTDTAEFIEIKWTPNTSLNGYIVVLFNGSNDQSYDTVDLSSATTDGNGLYVINFASNGLQNGADAAALYMDLATNFPNGTAPTTVNLIDAIVYGTSDADDTGLLTGLGETIQYDDTATESLNRSNDGTYYSAAPSAGAVNNVLSTQKKQIENFKMYPNPTSLGYVNISSRSNAKMSVSVFDVLGKQVINETVSDNRLSVSKLNAGIYIIKVSQEDATITKKIVIK